ncbi:L-lactate dehydrogenase (cytochrome)/(S)-mandelate dehydrogenase [Rhizobiales bacterium GAS188]|nr:L-lactate dehydrogenase (cytochrome)/(S)-mandelate dehydrogenase [Rhizobiales bacterium GAS188]
MTGSGGDWRRRAYSVAAMRAAARTALPRPIFDFADGGAEDERTLRGNETALAELRLLPRPLRGAASRDLSIELFGHRLSLPLLIAPTGLAGLFWPDGERAAARSAHAAGTIYCTSHASVTSLEAIAETGVSPRWMQVFVYRDRSFTRRFAERAAAARYDALVLTIDNQLTGNRERDLRNGFTIPPRFGPLAMAQMALKLPWLLRMRAELGRITFANYVELLDATDLKTIAARMPALLDPSMSWRDVDELRRLWSGPLLLKGILHPGDAREALEHGIDGLIVSNHGGRQLDGAVASIEALPRVVEAVSGRIPVLVDGGIRRGADVVAALALGAKACLIGRPHLWGLSVAGEAGVTAVLDIFRREIDRAMGLCGASQIAHIGPDLLFDPP